MGFHPTDLVQVNYSLDKILPQSGNIKEFQNSQSEISEVLPKVCFNQLESNSTENLPRLDECNDSNAEAELIMSNAVECATNDKVFSKTTARIVKAGQPNFLSDYYSNSRLHHISTAAADFKDFVNQLHINHKGDFPGRDLFLKWKSDLNENLDKSLLSKNQKIIMHLDMDCFFVSVALRYHPELIGKYIV